MTFDLASLGWDAAYAAVFAPCARPDTRPARVTRVDRGACTVISRNGVERATFAGTLLSAARRDPLSLPCAGDWVVLRAWPDRRTTVEGVLPRRTALVRSAAGTTSHQQVLAANVDAVAIVEPVDPEPDLARIERLLTLAWDSGAQPLVVLTKSDLARDPAAIAAQIGLIAPKTPVHAVSTVDGRGLHRLRPFVGSGRTLGLVGRSGAGKSSLVNALAGTAVMGTQEIRRVDGRGRHTTTYRALIPIPGGGAVLDTPGLRGVGLGAADAGIDTAFGDVAQLAARCQFTDCRHQGEPGCAVADALAVGELTNRRWENWQRLHREIAVETRRNDARRMADDRARWKRKAQVQRPRGVRP
ncbi:ribosome small subunit-dependent GTPase A [Luedemannella helvata]|uniref:Small ribosomal subunit biogenesis GTPase RsgA n=1 Tax=Luedemannella helvata TaxID=349315 RepID=A0ABP4WQQ0_9ACTN